MAKKKNYVNNKDLLAALIEYKSKCVEAEECGDKNPQVPDYIGKCIMLIAQRLATRPNFSGYMYKEEMVSDGIENCLQYIHNFNPEKSNNPFAYFTQIIYYAFIRRIQREKKQTHVKHRIISKADFQAFVTMEGDDTNYSVGGFDPNIMVPDEAVYNPKKKTKEVPKKGLENFMESDD